MTQLTNIGISGLILLIIQLAACTAPALPPVRGPADASFPQAKNLPRDNRVLLIIGQDLSSTSAYVKSGLFPAPGGITTYLAFYNLLSNQQPVYGALGQNEDGVPLTYDVNWGAGRLNAHSAALAYPDSSLVIGLSIAEGSGDYLWAEGELEKIGLGEHDDKIIRLAEFIKGIKIPVYLRIGYEFDGAWNRGYENTEHYIKAYQRIVDGMREESVGNVAFVWQASASPVDDLIDKAHEQISAWYPGDRYVDWIGLSWFLSPDISHHGSPTQKQLADEVLKFSRKRNKPVMIAESSPQGFDLQRLSQSNISPLWDGLAGQDLVVYTANQIWEQWFEPYFSYIRENRDSIRAVAYINANWDSQPKWSSPYREGYWGDSRVQINREISQRWRDQMSDTDFWLHGKPDLGKFLQ